MKEIISKYINRTLNDLINSGDIIKKDNFVFVNDSYIRHLEKVFSLVTNEIINIFNESVSEFIFIPETVIDSLKDLEKINEDKEEFLTFVKLVHDTVINIKNDFARIQKYDKAAKFRDIEIDIKEVFLPNLIKRNNPATLATFFENNKRGYTNKI